MFQQVPHRLCRRPGQATLRKLLLGATVLALLVVLIHPSAHQQVEAKKLKEKKALKSLVKGLIFKNLSTKKNFLPLPIPIPVPIELTDPPVFIKGKPKYVTVYKPRPMPIISSSYHYMLQPYDDSYAAHMMYPSYSSPYGGIKTSPSTDSSSINFTDFDDEFGSYYLRGKSSKGSHSYPRMLAGRNDDNYGLESRLSSEEVESIDNDDKKTLIRHKRQLYESSYEHEVPCYGFPLEINVKSRIKMDQVFPIHGKSQIKKCIKLELPRLGRHESSY